MSVDGKSPVIDESVFVAPTAAVTGDVTLEADASVFYGASLRGDTTSIRVGEQSNVQDNAVLHADPGAPCTVGQRVTIGHSAIVHGATVEDDCLIGMHSTVMNHAVIGSGSIVAAGALVLEGTKVPPRSLVAGVPAKVRREVSDAEFESIRRGADEYVRKGRQHRAAVADLG